MIAKKLGFGTMRLPLLDEKDQTSIDMKQFEKMIDTFLERGFTYFDTAYMYHDFTSETAVGKCLVQRHPRDSFTLADKLPVSMMKSYEDLAKTFDEQMTKCCVDYFDYYMLHNITASSYKNALKTDAFNFVRQKKEEGKIKKLGFSFHDSASLLDEVLRDNPGMDFVQLQINYIDWDNESIQSRKCYEVAEKYGVPVIVMEPVKGGTLSNIPSEAADVLKAVDSKSSITSWAIRFAASQEKVFMVLSGMGSMDQLEDNMSYMDNFVPFDKVHYDAVSKVVSIINSSISIPCTACRYCTDGCPKNIPIPEYFALYNADEQALNQGFSTQEVYYGNLATEGRKASDCIACGQCEKICPQHIDIINQLKNVAKVFE